ncbi:MAG TPA: tRNA-dihydrouridine synthase family protein [Candidatus Thalassarchaeaceae archaeon]|nr:MAG TPA: tRNA-dihydrouridine synthase family protein [Candidatus Poseidoniales archaeon]HIH82454.1 tRNA-dihydrouridine synthase family protein [Candidatus Thalassarchaeaceae archaeon]
MMAGEVEQVPLFLAPMAGVTDLAFRLLARECGADFTISEFTAAAALTRQDSKSWHKLESDPRETPFIPQIFGGKVEEMVQSCELLQDVADLIDLNFGCPAPKVTRHCAGAALMGRPDELVGMVEKCVEVSKVPITVKMRLGTGTERINALELAKRVQDVGVERICVHGRTLRQRYSGVADWQAIAEIVDAVDIPVVANGDIVDAASAAKCLQITGAAGLMIGRSAIGRPTIFQQIKSQLDWDSSPSPWESSSSIENQASARLWAWRRYVNLDDELNELRQKSSSEEVEAHLLSKNRLRHAFAFTKELPGSKAFRTELHSNRGAMQLSTSVEAFLVELVTASKNQTQQD